MCWWEKIIFKLSISIGRRFRYIKLLLSGEYLVASISFFITIFALEEVLNRTDCTLEAMMIKARMITCKK